MKIVKRSLAIVFATILALLSSFAPIFAYDQEVDHAMDINSLHVIYDVKENGYIDVNAVYDVTFYESKHGMVYNIPVRQEMTWNIDGKEKVQSYYFPVSNITANAPFSTESGSDVYTLYLGDEDTFVSGEQHYEISYRMNVNDFEKLPTPVFYWNIFSTGTPNFTAQATAEIHMPSSFQESDLYFYSGAYGDKSSNVNYTSRVVGNTIYVDAKNLNAYEGVTMSLDVPDDYFTYAPKPDYSNAIFAVAPIVLLVIGGLYMLAGKKEEVVVISSYKAPEGLTSGEVAKIIGKIGSMLSIPAMLIEWANKGLLAIHEDKPEGTKNKESKFTFERLSDDTSELKPHERIVFNKLFKNIEENDNGKYMIEMKALEKRCEKLNGQSVMTSINRTVKDRGYRMFTTKSSVSLGISSILVVALGTIMGFIAILASQRYIQNFFEGLGILTFLAIILLLVSTILISTAAGLRFGSFNARLATWLIGITTYIASAFVLILYLKSYEIAILPYLIGYISIGLSYILFASMLRVPATSAQILGEILGFREYIEKVEVDNLRVNVEEFPNLFFSILPFAYVFGLNELWIKKFEGLTFHQPDWYYGNNMYGMNYWMFYHSFHRSTSYLRSVGVVSLAQGTGKGGGSFSSGGGFSGGGFSGGGFSGGGGGGSW